MHILLVDFHFYEYTISLANALATQVRVSVLVPANFEEVADKLSSEVDVYYFGKHRLRSMEGVSARCWPPTVIRKAGP